MNKRCSFHISGSFFAVLLALAAVAAPTAHAQEGETEETPAQGINPDFIEQSVFQDYNGDGELRIVAFGDSLTVGVGDFVAANEFVESAPAPASEASYPLRIEALAGVLVSNEGRSGERLAIDGLERFARTVPGLRPDIVLLLEGANDAVFTESSTLITRDLQTALNISRASGAEPVLLTIPPTCCDRAGRNIFVDSYSTAIRTLGAVNDVRVADVNRAFKNTCQVNQCYLLNRPEGLHPNIEGYDVMGETVLSAMLGIDIFAP
ncbi:MAG: SGNH/GDSL hydrolase family protein, partial [Bdellovibrionales bacterium]|nr:SGNH/GDSL hydrolase family protein [Bdellovibrionales bacterium]